MRILVAALLFLSPALAWACSGAFEVKEARPADDKTGWHRLVGILSYLEADYPAAVETQSAFELEEQRSFIREAILAARGLGSEGAPFVDRLEAIRVRVEKGEDPEGVSRECKALADEVVKVSGLARSPSQPPDLRR